MLFSVNNKCTLSTDKCSLKFFNIPLCQKSHVFTSFQAHHSHCLKRTEPLVLLLENIHNRSDFLVEHSHTNSPMMCWCYRFLKEKIDLFVWFVTVFQLLLSDLSWELRFKSKKIFKLRNVTRLSASDTLTVVSRYMMILVTDGTSCHVCTVVI